MTKEQIEERDNINTINDLINDNNQKLSSAYWDRIFQAQIQYAKDNGFDIPEHLIQHEYREDEYWYIEEIELT